MVLFSVTFLLNLHFKRPTSTIKDLEYLKVMATESKQENVRIKVYSDESEICDSKIEKIKTRHID